MDIDPTTEEGQQDINATADTEYDDLLKRPDESTDLWRERMKRKFGREWNAAVSKLRGAFKRKNPGGSVPEYLELQNMEEGETVEWAIGRLKELYPNFDADEVKLSEKDNRVFISVRDLRYADKWTKPQHLFDANGEVRAAVARLKGFEQATGALLDRLRMVNENAAALKELDELKGEMEEKDRDFMKQTGLLQEAHQRETADKNERILQLTQEKNKAAEERDAARRAFDLAREEAGLSQDEVKNLETTIAGSLEERRQLMARINTVEEQLRQREQAIEELERQTEEQRAIINDNARTEEEIEAAKTKLENLQERIAEMQSQKENLERELGLTTKEKIKRTLLKWLPPAFAVAVISAVGVIISMLKAAGAGVKKVGQGLANLGKKMAASIPGLLGSVLSLVLRTGGELLKFVGNNIWILVVAIGAVLLKRLK